MIPMPRALTATVVLLTAVGLTGCGTSRTITAPDGSKVSVNGDGGKVTIKSSDGSVSVGGDLPEGFPTQDIPIVSGKVLSGIKGGSGGRLGWVVTLQVGGELSAVDADATAKLKAGGYAQGQGITTDGLITHQFTGPKYDVGLNLTKSDADVTVMYTVTKHAG